MTEKKADDEGANQPSGMGLLHEIEFEKERLLSELQALTGEPLNAALWSGRVQPHWPESTADLAAAYNAASSAAAALRSKQQVARMRRFMAAPDEPSERAWWLNRY
ncbi:hypothetical protein [Rhodosalinus sp. K401]|uniref:hypothetical protein n=1 Tax=Rhodosalinus sp. K401 TaxID=3239195 RepID=UPI00352335F5